nr:hypothetical protein [Comamonas fluminis]
MTHQKAHLTPRLWATLATSLLVLTLATDSLAARKAHSGRVKIQNIRSSSDESTAERDRRLYRECQGRPNSGACAGYTQRQPSSRR